MRLSTVKAKLRRREPVLGVALHLTDPSVHELVSLMGFDFIWLDMEHHPYSLETGTQAMRGARVGNTDIMARCAKGEYMRMGRMLEAAHGIMYPRCNSAAEAREVVQWMKFAPQGTRGVDGANPDQPYGMGDLAAYLKRANEETWLVAQIEDDQALANAEEIAAVDGVDVIILGPGDYSILGGVPGQFDHPKVQNAIQQVRRAAERAGKAWGMPTGSPQKAKELLDMGALWTTCGSDITHLCLKLAQIQKDYASLGFKWQPRTDMTA